MLLEQLLGPSLLKAATSCLDWATSAAMAMAASLTARAEAVWRSLPATASSSSDCCPHTTKGPCSPNWAPTAGPLAAHSAAAHDVPAGTGCCSVQPAGLLLFRSLSSAGPATGLTQLGMVRPRARAFNVPHVRQLFNWDCGLACVLMVLRTLGIRTQDLYSLRALCATTSIWTIDLAHLLRHFGLGVVFATTMLGTNPQFAREAFYAESMAKDARRVACLFEAAGMAGIAVQRRSLSAVELQGLLLAGSHIIIALVDKGCLAGHAASSHGKFGPGGIHLGMLVPVPAYVGHYVVVCGYDSDADAFTVRDPAAPAAAVCVLSTAELDAARRAFGTDEDLLLVATAHRHTSRRERFFQSITQFML